MKKRIYANMLLLSFISIALVSVFLSIVFYLGFDGQVKGELRSKAVLLEQILNQNRDDLDYLRQLDLSDGEVRITIVAADGSVLYDNLADPATMENHAQREEIIEALTGGTGESDRVSSTFGERTYYYAKKLSSKNVLRMSKMTDSIYHVFMQSLPVSIIIILLIFLLSHFIAKSLTKKITRPINEIDLSAAECIYDELSPLIRTITGQRKQIDGQISQLEQRATTITAIIENMSEGILLLDNAGTILTLNHSLVQIFGTGETATGRNIIEITRNTEIIEHSRSALNGVRASATVDIAAKTYTVFFSPVAESGAIVLFLDITERANAEKMRREFSANVSHEIKTPLTSVLGYAEMITSGMAKEGDLTAFAGKIKDEAARLLNLIEDIIKLSELDETGHAQNFTRVDMEEVAEQVLESLRDKAAACGVTVEPECSAVAINADGQMMFELLYNLLDNAIKYSKPGGRVNLTVKPDGGTAKIIVADNGIGVPREHIGRIFERFYRVDKSHSKKTGGTGLGLSIVKHIVACHGGRIKVESEENTGTRFEVVLPERARE